MLSMLSSIQVKSIYAKLIKCFKIMMIHNNDWRYDNSMMNANESKTYKPF